MGILKQCSQGCHVYMPSKHLYYIFVDTCYHLGDSSRINNNNTCICTYNQSKLIYSISVLQCLTLIFK